MMKRNLAFDSLILVTVRVLTMITGIIQTMILARILTKTDYGTFSQTIIIISVGSIVFGFGLSNAINYYYNKESILSEKKEYVSTIFGLCIFSGLVGGLLIWGLSGTIGLYFNNPFISYLILYIAFRPLLFNLISLYQQLYISSNLTKDIAVRNIIVSMLQISIVVIASVLTASLLSIIILLLVLEIIQVIYFGFTFSYKKFKIRLALFKLEKIKSILSYSLPLALAMVLGTILKDMDKIYIVNFVSLEDFAMYSIVSKQLPFEFVATSLTIIITPIVIYLVSNNQLLELKRIWGNYIELGLTSTWILCIGAILISKELIEILYTSKYIDGLQIFIVYIIIEMFRFTYYGLLLTAKGLTKWIFVYSIISIIVNIILNIVLFKLLGLIGPAVATLISILTIGMLQLAHGMKSVNIKTLDVINFKFVFVLMLQLLAVSLISIMLKYSINYIFQVPLLTGILVYGFFVIAMILLRHKRFQSIFMELKNIKY